MRWPFSQIPESIIALVRASVSLNRIRDFLYAGELEDFNGGVALEEFEAGMVFEINEKIYKNLKFCRRINF
jgi:hypothetical protein